MCVCAPLLSLSGEGEDRRTRSRMAGEEEERGTGGAEKPAAVRSIADVVCGCNSQPRLPRSRLSRPRHTQRANEARRVILRMGGER